MPQRRDDAPTIRSTAATEYSSLLRSSDTSEMQDELPSRFTSRRFFTMLAIAFPVVVIFLLSYQFLTHTISQFQPQSTEPVDNRSTVADNTGGNDPFPSKFVWGVATSAYQIEGAVAEDGRGETIWDVFVRTPGAVLDGGTGNVADDHYHLYQDDVALMKSLGVTAYRFSMAWSRILPTGRGLVNQAGLAFYDRLIDELLAHNIEPWVTLFHWDLPQALQEDFDGGWLDPRTVDAFCEYARVVFQKFGSKVKRFITLNEPWTYSVVGHVSLLFPFGYKGQFLYTTLTSKIIFSLMGTVQGSGVHAPGRKDHPATEPYLAAHNFLLAHARVSKMYKREFAGVNGMIGISNCGDFRYPYAESSEHDQEAALRAMLFQWGWFVEPLFFGRYPTAMRERLGDRLPHFTAAEQEELVGSADFLGLNYYSSLLASAPKREATYDGYWADIHVDFTDDPEWTKNDMGWNVVPNGLREMLLWISERYNNPLIYITENGSAEAESDINEVIHDGKRKHFFQGHIRACAEAIEKGVDLAGYFAWSLMDNFEWQFGYQRRFGICHVDYDTLERTPRDSAIWYQDTIRSNGRNIAFDDVEVNNLDRRMLKSTHRYSQNNRTLPNKILIGYGSDCHAVRRAVRDGVNIVIWSFVDIRVSPAGTVASSSRRLDDRSRHATVATTLNLTAIRNLVDELKHSGYHDVLHFASVGGWNGAHLDPEISANEWYDAFNDGVGDIFDGIDWDLEGNDQMFSSYNFFTFECLDKMGAISQLAKNDGRFVSMAPPQSYLDIDSERFSRYVNLTDSSRRDWHIDFSYFGANVYAYVLHRYGEWVDLVSIQFYESYSRAAKAVYHDGTNASDYIVRFINKLSENNETFFVDFPDDPDVDISRQAVALPLQKLVLGLGNGWAGSGDEKALFIAPEQLSVAWQILHQAKSLPRGFMFWTIDLEGSNGIYLAHDLHLILRSES